jgi:hypothetical protein
MNLDHVFVTACVKKELFAVAAVRTSRKGVVRAAFAEKVAPKNDRHSEYRDLPQIMESLRHVLLEDDVPYVVVGYDIAPLKRHFQKAFPFEEVWVDVAQLAWPLLLSQVVPSGKFPELCRHFNVTNEAPGTATGDCTALTQLYWAMMTRYKTSLAAEEVAREMGGKTLATVRNWFGV